MNAPWTTLNISDGSANGYRFTRDGAGRVQFVYDPVTREQSSSGQYDGGPPRKEDLAGDDPRLTELWALLQKLQADPRKHTTARNKGTGAIAWEGANGKQAFIVEMGPEVTELVRLLGRFGS